MPISNTFNIEPAFFFSDATSYAHHVFKAFDVNTTGAISFRVSTAFIMLILARTGPADWSSALELSHH